MILSFVDTILLNLTLASSKIKYYEPKKRKKPVRPMPQRLPDLIVKDIKLIQDCKIEVTIANIGSAGVPDPGYHPNH